MNPIPLKVTGSESSGPSLFLTDRMTGQGFRPVVIRAWTRVCEPRYVSLSLREGERERDGFYNRVPLCRIERQRNVDKKITMDSSHTLRSGS